MENPPNQLWSSILGGSQHDGIRWSETKIDTKGKSIDCDAFVPRARFCELRKALSQPQKSNHSMQGNIISGIHMSTEGKTS